MIDMNSSFYRKKSLTFNASFSIFSRSRLLNCSRFIVQFVAGGGCGVYCFHVHPFVCYILVSEWREGNLISTTY